MVQLILLAERFLRFFRDNVVPFFTVTPDTLTIPIFDPLFQRLRFVTVPWFLGDITFAEFILITGLIAFIVVRLIKFFTDLVGL